MSLKQLETIIPQRADTEGIEIVLTPGYIPGGPELGSYLPGGTYPLDGINGENCYPFRSRAGRKELMVLKHRTLGTRRP